MLQPIIDVFNRITSNVHGALIAFLKTITEAGLLKDSRVFYLIELITNGSDELCDLVIPSGGE